MKPYLAKVVGLQPGYRYPFKNGDVVLILGEIAQMPGHLALSTRSGKVLFGYHSENFRKLRRNEA